MAQHVNERIQAEFVDLASEYIVEPRLRYVEQSGRLTLGHPSRNVPNPRHQLGAKQQIVRLFRAEPQIRKDISAAASSFELGAHRLPFSWIKEHQGRALIISEPISHS